MTRPRILSSLLLALIAALLMVPGALGQTPAGVDAAFDAARRYAWGESRQPLRVIERAVVAALGDPAAAEGVEARLIALLESPDVTAAGRSFACRQLAIIGGEASVPALARWLGDPALSHMARRALEVIPALEARTALAQAADDLDDPLKAAMVHSLRRRDGRIEALVTRGGPDDVLRLVDLAGAGSAAARTALERMRGPGIDDALAGIAADSSADPSADPSADDNPARAVVATRLLGLRGAVDRRDLLDRLAAPGHPASVRCAAMLAVADVYDWRHDPGRVRLLADAMDIAPTAADRRAVLAAIEQRGDPVLLGLAQRHMRASDTRADAARAVIVLALALEPTDRHTARAALEEIEGDFTDDPEILKQAGEALARVDRNESYLEGWRVAGPYPKGATEGSLIDVAFAPEASVRPVEWRPVPESAWREPGIVDLKKMLGGNDRCAYAAVQITSGRAQPARLEVGSDDGVKIWLNGAVVHRNDVARGLTLRQDVIDVELRAGSNDLLVKVTQGGGDWQFAVRLRGPNGRRLDDVEP